MSLRQLNRLVVGLAFLGTSLSSAMWQDGKSETSSVQELGNISTEQRGAQVMDSSITAEIGGEGADLLAEFFNHASLSEVRKLTRVLDGKVQSVTLLHTDASNRLETLKAVFQLILNTESLVQDSVNLSRNYVGAYFDVLSSRVRRLSEIVRTSSSFAQCCGTSCHEFWHPKLTLGEVIHQQLREAELEKERKDFEASYAKQELKLTVAESLDKIFPPSSARAVFGSAVTVASAALYGVGSIQAVPGVVVGAIVILDAGLQKFSPQYRSFCFHGRYEQRIQKMNIEKIQTELLARNEVVVVTNTQLSNLADALKSMGFEEISLLNVVSDVPVEMKMQR